MGLGSMEGKRTNYLTVVKGKLAQRFDLHEQVEGSEVRKLEGGDNIGKEVREKYYPYVEGIMESVILSEKPWGVTDLEVTLRLNDVEGQPSYTVVLPSNKGVFYDFAKRVPNISTEPEVSTLIGIGTDDKRIFLYMKQGGEKVPMHYTKDNPDGMPDPVERKGKGWDYSAREDWLYEKLEQWVDSLNGSDTEDIPF